MIDQAEGVRLVGLPWVAPEQAEQNPRRYHTVGRKRDVRACGDAAEVEWMRSDSNAGLPWRGTEMHHVFAMLKLLFFSAVIDRSADKAMAAHALD